MTVKKWIEFLQNSTKNMNAEVIFIESKKGNITCSSSHMCRHCEVDIIISVPIYG